MWANTVARAFVAAILMTAAANGAVCVQPARLGVNVLANSGAELGICTRASRVPVHMACWAGKAANQCYGTPGGFPTAKSPGPPGAARGRAFFAGGLGVKVTSIAQAVVIPPGARRFTFGAWLGGSFHQSDHVVATVRFYTAGAVAKLLKTFTLPIITDVQRNDVTGLLLREVRAGVPGGARKAVVSLVFVRSDDTNAYNDGYVDNVHLIFA